MTNLKQRLTLLEGARTKADIRAMSDDELMRTFVHWGLAPLNAMPPSFRGCCGIRASFLWCVETGIAV